MGKTKTALISGTEEKNLSGADKYKLRQQKKAQEASGEKKAVKGVGLKGGEKLKMVESDFPNETVVPEADSTQTTKKGPRVRGKKYNESLSRIDKSKLYSVAEAIALVKATSFSKFDGTVEVHATTKKESLSVNVSLPHSAGKEKKVQIADDKTIIELKLGKVNFDVLLATADMMPKLVPFAKLLGPKGLMPNPKTGTLLKDVKDAKKFSGNTLTVKTEKKAPLVHFVIGKVSQSEKELEANLEAVLKAFGPKQLLKCYLTSSMGPSVKVKVN